MSSQQVTHCQLCKSYKFGPHEGRFEVTHKGKKMVVCPSCKAKFCEYCNATLRMYELENTRTGSAITLCSGCTKFHQTEDPAWHIKKNVHTEA